MIAQARKSRAGRARPAPANSRGRRTVWGVRQRAAGVLSALLLGVVTLVSPGPASAVGTVGAAAAGPVQRTLAQQTDRPARTEHSRTSVGAPTRTASAGVRTPEHTRQHAHQPDVGVLPFTTRLPLPRAHVECDVRSGAGTLAAEPPGLPDVRGPPSGSSHPHCPDSAPPYRPR